MPNRIIRDWTDSLTMDSLKTEEEVLFVRLIMKADDHGNFHANSKMIKSLCFPLKETIRLSDIERWLGTLQAAGLIRKYEAKGTQFLNIINFGQRLRQKKRMFPDPDDFSSCQPLVSDPPATGGLKRREEETEVEKREKGFAPPSQEEVCNYFLEKLDDFTAQAEANKFVNFYESKNWFVGKNKMKDWNAAARGWIARMNDFKPKNNGTHQQPFGGSKPGTADEQNAATERW